MNVLCVNVIVTCNTYIQYIVIQSHIHTFQAQEKEIYYFSGLQVPLFALI